MADSTVDPQTADAIKSQAADEMGNCNDLYIAAATVAAAGELLALLVTGIRNRTPAGTDATQPTHEGQVLGRSLLIGEEDAAFASRDQIGGSSGALDADRTESQAGRTNTSAMSDDTHAAGASQGALNTRVIGEELDA
ncbi:MAG: hypothetical protein LBP51_07490 [Deferribacteraceae bacterium]|jgi:hypothetical protein|nr:hypothetical protein [Deferribacteraceae bacterium]